MVKRAEGISPFFLVIESLWIHCINMYMSFVLIHKQENNSNGLLVS